jgi:hypothetical protein
MQLLKDEIELTVVLGKAFFHGRKTFIDLRKSLVHLGAKIIYFFVQRRITVNKKIELGIKMFHQRSNPRGYLFWLFVFHAFDHNKCTLKID